MTPQLPPGFQLDAPPPLPPGFVPDEGAPAPAAAPAQRGIPQIPGIDPQWAAGQTPAQLEERRRREQLARNPIRDRAVGAVEAALEIAARVVGGGAGGLVGLTGALGGGAGESGMAAGAQKGTGVVRDIYRQVGLTTGEEPQTATGQALTGGFEKAMENLPPIVGVHGSLRTPKGSGGVAVRAAGDTVRAAGDAALEAATPRMSPEKAALAGKAVEAGIPINVHQVSDSKIAKLVGEMAEHIPLSGSKRAARQEAFTNGIARSMDPESTATRITPEVFAEMQDKAGAAIGEISARTPVPKESFGDITSVARRQTPDVQKVIQTYADDLAQIAEENGGIVPGDTLRRLRTEAQTQARGTNNGDLKTTLNNFVSRIDDAISEHAVEGDMAALLDARRRYAISITLEPLVAKSADGAISPGAVMSAVTSTKAGKHRMARGKGGELGDYARMGQQFLKDVGTSNTTERNIVFKTLTDAVEAAKIGATWAPATLYNVFGPKIVKRMVEAQRRREAPTPEGPAPEPGLARGFEDVPQGGAPAARSPLGDLTPEWETAPGAASPREGGIEPAGLVPAVGEESPLPQGIPQRPGAQIPLAEDRPLGDLTPEWTTAPGAGGAAARAAEPGLVRAIGEQPPTTGPRAALTERAGQQIPAVPGRPDLPDTLLTGGPAETAATEAANTAMLDPGAIEARRQQGMAGVERAAAAERAEPVPVGEATEITPRNVRPAPEMREPAPEPIPVGEATEIRPEVVKPAPAIKEHPEVLKVKGEIEKKRAAEAKKQADADALRDAAAAETDPEIKAALVARADKIAPAKEKANAPRKVDEQAGVQSERGQGNEGGQAAEAGGGDRVQREAKGGKAEGEESLSVGDLPSIDEAFADAQLRLQQSKEPPPSPRGRRQVRRMLEQGAADGTLNKDGASLALWALDKNPHIAAGLKAEVRAGVKPGVQGAYDSANRIVKIFQGEDNPQTALHEILHHSERMMPVAVQQGIRRAWERALKAEKDVSPERRAALDALPGAVAGDANSLAIARKALKDGVLDVEKDYHLVNPTEFWAVNGTRIMHERFTGRGSWRAQARQWLREMIEHVKGLVGVRSDSPILKALEEILDPKKTTGTDRAPTMIKSMETGASP